MRHEVEEVEILLKTLTPREERVLRARLGLFGEAQKRPGELAGILDLTYQRIVAIEQKALRKLDHPSRGRLLGVLLAPVIELSEPLESLKTVSPQLIAYLRRQNADIGKVAPRVFEEIVAELLAAQGFGEVKLVGRNSETSADILAGYFLPGGGASRVRVFIEVKRWRDRVGVEVFNAVLGAMVSERERFGWHQGWIVALGGVTDTEKLSREQWRMKGLEVKDSTDLTRWLDGYEPHHNGLWLPPDAFDGRVEQPVDSNGAGPQNNQMQRTRSAMAMRRGPRR